METFKSNNPETKKLTEHEEMESSIMLYIRSFLKDICYDLTWGDLVLIKNLTNQTIIDIKQHQKEIQNALEEGAINRAEDIAYAMPENYYEEALARFLDQRFDGLTFSQLSENYPDKKGGEFLKRQRNAQELI